MKRLLLFITISVLFIIAASAAWYVSKLHPGFKTISSTPAKSSISDKTKHTLINTYANPAKQFCKTNKFNSQICFIADMSIESGKNRFFVYDMKGDSILLTGLVTHGRCNQNWLRGKKFGNTIGCGCTSLGKYKIGNPYYGRFGLAFKLYGLDSSNSHAYDRFVVLHSMGCVTEEEVYPYPICQSDGCPAVSPGFMKKLASIINASTQPVLLWIVDSY